MIKLKDHDEIRPTTPEAAIDRILSSEIREITPEAVLACLAPTPEPDAEARDKMLNRICRELENHEDLIPMRPGECYCAAEKLFDDAEFLIVPDGFEIENRILVPGHRFAIFMASEVFPSEIELREAGARRPVGFRKFRSRAEILLKYHLFMGAESLFDFFAAEDHANIAAAEESGNPELALSVLDMEKFYRETEFSEGDALLVKVTDYRTGRFEFRLDNGQARSARAAKLYRRKFEETLHEVIESHGAGRVILEQLRMTLANAPELLRKPALSPDELLLTDSPADIVFDPDDGSTLIWREEDMEQEPGGQEDGECHCGHEHRHHAADGDSVPDGISISAGETGSLEAMLKTLYPMLNMVELDAFLLDGCKNYDYDFNSFYSRAFGETPLGFADAAQEAVFFNELEDRLEEFKEHYPREFDQTSAELRSDIVDFTMERCALLAELAALEEHPDIPPALFEQLADATLRLDEILKLVNHPDTIPENCDFGALRDAVDRALDDGADALAAMSKVLEGDD